MNPDTARMHRLTLRFTDAGLEAAFAEEQARKALKPFRVGLLCVAGVMLILWLLLDDLLPYIPHTRSQFSILMPTFFAILALGYWVSYTHFFLLRHQRIVVGRMWGFAAVLVGICSLTARGAVPIAGKGEMHTFLLLPADGNTHSVEGAEK
jgi:hypothetical protein